MFPASFSGGSAASRISRAAIAVSAAVVLGLSGQAMADHKRGNDCGNSLTRRGYSRSHHYDNSCDRGRSRVSINIGSSWGNCGSSGWGINYSYGRGYRDYNCRPACPPVVVRDYCPPPRVIVTNPCPPRVIERQVIVERPVEVERVVERPVYVDRVVEKPVERVVYVQPTAPAAEAPGYRDRELGDAYMRMSDWNNAVRVYSRYLTAWDKDGTATRNLGLAQIGAGQTREGFRNVVKGYELESGLLDRPLRISDFGGEQGLNQLIDASVRAADSTNMPEGWYTVAVLQSIAGQNESALNAVKKARDAGLSADLLDKLTLRVSGSGS